jgi:hypothetical protein
VGKHVTREEMEAVSAGIYDAIGEQFRDRLPHGVEASPQNADIFRASFGVVPSLVDDLFKRLQYTEGKPWPMWKLVAAFYLVEARIGQNSVRSAGEKIYATMPWPPEVRSISDALRFTEVAYAESHLRAPRALVGGWTVESQTPTRTVLVDETPYPCHVSEGVMAGICVAFRRQKPAYKLLDAGKAKRDGGPTTRYEVEHVAV